MSKYWNLQGTIARVSRHTLAGQVDVSFPWRGFEPAAAPRAGVALLKVFTRATALDAPETLVEHYDRGVDLVATYAQTPERNFRPQVYWRVIEQPVDAAAASAGLEVIVSTQTSLLDSQPLVALESVLPPGEVQLWSAQGEPLTASSGVWQTGSAAACVVLFRPRDWSLSYCELAQAADISAMQVELGEFPSIRWQMFPESLEKGVIRRGRVRGVFLPREQDEQLARAAWRALVDSPDVLSV